MQHRLDDIATFIQVVEAGSITQAAHRLNVAKSAVSKRVSDLEAILDARLLHRSSHRVQPTDKGLLFYERARRIWPISIVLRRK